MRDSRNTFRNWLIFIPLLLIIVVLVGGLTYLSARLSMLPMSTQIIETPLLVTPISTLNGTPIQRFAQVNPAIVDFIDIAPSNYGDSRLFGLEIQPVGVYLPRTGDTQFEITEPTALPTPLPFPTSPALPVPPISELPTVDTSSERILSYAGDDCAPADVPIEGILSQRFHRYHSGIDIATPLNTPVLATHSGQVTFADWSDVGYGYLVIIQNNNFITYYAHNTSFNVNSGDFVGKDSVIAWSGSTGNSSGPHIHYEIRINDIPVDPLTFGGRGYETC